ncbi:MAG: hypothetical protein NVS4B10_11790 [Myxococcales bacterium]
MAGSPAVAESRAFIPLLVASVIALIAATAAVSQGPVPPESPPAELSSIAVALDASGCDHPRHGPDDSASFGGISRISVDPVVVRYPMTSRGWPGVRLALATDRGPGAVVFVALPRGPCYLGRGALRGWSQESLAKTFGRLAPSSPDLTVDRTQLD